MEDWEEKAEENAFETEELEQYLIRRRRGKYESFSRDSGYEYASKYRGYYDPRRFRCYQHRQTNLSLFKAFVSWFVCSILSVILSIPIMSVACILSVILPSVSWALFGRYIVFIWTITLLPLLYILYMLNVFKTKIDIFYSITLLLVSVLFNRSLIFTFRLRHRIRTRFQKHSKLQRFDILDEHCFTKWQFQISYKTNLTLLLRRFAKDYSIWG
eukprot:76377_1